MNIKRYSNSGFKSDIYPFIISPEYDDVVDSSNFRPDSETTRMFRVSGSGSIAVPKYDTEPDKVSDIEVALRTGKLDKAEVSQLVLAKKEEVKISSDKAKKEAAIEEAKKISEARQEYLDKATGFEGLKKDN